MIDTGNLGISANCNPHCLTKDNWHNRHASSPDVKCICEKEIEHVRVRQWSWKNRSNAMTAESKIDTTIESHKQSFSSLRTALESWKDPTIWMSMSHFSWIVYGIARPGVSTIFFVDVRSDGRNSKIDFQNYTSGVMPLASFRSWEDGKNEVTKATSA